MHPVTTGPGISGIFADELTTLLTNFRTECNDKRWRLYIESLGTQEYFLRIYAPDLHSEVHKVTRNANIMDAILKILGNEGTSWQSRVALALSSAPSAEAEGSSSLD